MEVRATDSEEAARLFRLGKSKAEIARAMGTDKKKVGKMLAKANAQHAKGANHGAD